MRPARAAAAAAALLAASACSTDRREAERAVRAYDEAVIQAYRSRDLSRLREVATEAERGKVLALVDLKTASRLVLESELQTLAVTEVRRAGPGRMAVQTRERWRYWDRPLDPGKPQGTVFVADMTLEYRLVREGDDPWRVEAVRALSNEFVEPKGGRPGAGRGGAAAAQDSR